MEAQSEVRLDAARTTSLFARGSAAGGSAIVRGNQVGGKARAQFGHQYGDRNETHYHFYQQLKVTSNATARTTSSKVVGSVLTGLKLASIGVGFYANAVQTIRRFREAAKEFKRLQDRLDAEYDVLVNRLELLLGDSLDASTLRDLFEGIKAWDSPLVEELLQQRLGRVYEEFVAVIADLDHTVEDVRGGLAINNEGKVPFSDDARQLIATLRRLRYGLCMKEYRAQIKSIKAKVLQIEDMTARCQDLGIESSKQKGKTPDFDAYRQRATSLFASLRAAVSEDCAHWHRASLALALPTRDRGHRSLLDAEASCLDLLLHHDSVLASTSSPSWTIAEIQVRPLQGVSNIGKKETRQQRSRVRFRDFLEPLPQPQMSPALDDSQAQWHPETGIIDNLCWAIQTQHQRLDSNRSCLGALPHTTSSHRHSLHWNKRPDVVLANMAEKTLRHALQAPEERRPSILHRRRLALSLSMAVLQLHGTPWLAEQWRKEDILFDFTLEKPIGPFLSVSLGNCAEMRPSGHSTPDYPVVRNSTVFSLGIILIELALDTSLEELSDLGVEGVSSLKDRFHAAVELIGKVEHKFGFRYANVVRRCVLCDFDYGKCSLDDRGFQEKVFLRVVKELEEEVAYLEPGGL